MKKLIIGLLLVFVLVGAAACAQSTNEKGATQTAPPVTYTTAVPATTVPPGKYFGEQPVPIIVPAPTIIMPSQIPQAGSGSVVYDSANIDRMIIRTGYLTLVVE